MALRRPGGAIADSVGYGTAVNSIVEKKVAPAPAAGNAIARFPDGADTNDNSADFKETATPTPGAANR